MLMPYALTQRKATLVLVGQDSQGMDSTVQVCHFSMHTQAIYSILVYIIAFIKATPHRLHPSSHCDYLLVCYLLLLLMLNRFDYVTVSTLQILMSVLWVLVVVVPTESVWTPLAVSPVFVTLDTLEMGHSVSVSLVPLDHSETMQLRDVHGHDFKRLANISCMQFYVLCRYR